MLKQKILSKKAIENRIHKIRGQNVILDFDLALLYGVETRALKQAVKRNIKRFPPDFLIQLTNQEITSMVSQFVIPSKSNFGGAKPYAFTEQGVAMLSSVLKSEKAVEINIAIMRAFVFIRRYSITHRNLKTQLKELEMKFNKQFKNIYDALSYLLRQDEVKVLQKTRKRIGYKVDRP